MSMQMLIVMEMESLTMLVVPLMMTTTIQSFQLKIVQILGGQILVQYPNAQLHGQSQKKAQIWYVLTTVQILPKEHAIHQLDYVNAMLNSQVTIAQVMTKLITSTGA